MMTGRSEEKKRDTHKREERREGEEKEAFDG